MDPTFTFHCPCIHGMGEEINERRVFVGGLNSQITKQDLYQKFSSFGEVEGVEVAAEQVDGTGPRGFAHLTLRSSDQQWQRLQSAYNGTNWKGTKLRIELARYSGPRLRELERKAIPSLKSKTLRKRPLIRHYNPKENKLMTDSQLDVRKGWKKSRYGRAVALMRIRALDGRLITVDPDHYRDRITKLFGSGRPKKITELTWFYPETRQRINKAKGVEQANKDFNDKKLVVEPVQEDDQVIEKDKDDTNDNDASNTTSLKGFSLGKLLGLTLEPEVESALTLRSDQPPDHVITLPEITVSFKKKNPPLDTILYDSSQLDTLPLTDYAFCRRSGKEEAYMIWKEQRRVLRMDYKQRLKQVKRLAQRRLARSHNSSKEDNIINSRHPK